MANRLIRKECEVYLAYVIDMKVNKSELADVPVVWESLDVILEELSGLSPDREIEFSIDLVSGTGPMSKALYRMTQ